MQLLSMIVIFIDFFTTPFYLYLSIFDMSNYIAQDPSVKIFLDIIIIFYPLKSANGVFILLFQLTQLRTFRTMRACMHYIQWFFTYNNINSVTSRPSNNDFTTYKYIFFSSYPPN